nr:MAG TPA: hypothetical protein [Herelleviridae sp.]
MYDFSGVRVTSAHPTYAAVPTPVLLTIERRSHMLLISNDAASNMTRMWP